MSALRKAKKPGAFNHSYNLVPGPTSNRALAAVINTIATMSGIPKSNFTIKRRIALRSGQPYASITVKGRKISSKEIENRPNGNYEKIRNKIVKAIFGGNARNRASALGLASVFSKNIKTGKSARTNVLTNNLLKSKIFTMAYPTAGHMGNFGKTVRNIKSKSAARRASVGSVRYWNPQ